jgi:quinol monooxygenase YgiN
MIHVIATIKLKNGTRAAFLEHLMANVPAVLAEQGCHGYTPAIDVDSGLAAQGPLRDDTVVIVEAWSDLACLNAHLVAPHMTTYREKVKDMVDSVGLQVLQSA